MRDKAKDPEQNLVRQGLNWAHLEKDNKRNKNLYKNQVSILLDKYFLLTGRICIGHTGKLHRNKYIFPKPLGDPSLQGMKFLFSVFQPTLLNLKRSLLFLNVFQRVWFVLGDDSPGGRRGDRTKFLLKTSYLVFSLDLQFVHDQTC